VTGGGVTQKHLVKTDESRTAGRVSAGALRPESGHLGSMRCISILAQKQNRWRPALDMSWM